MRTPHIWVVECEHSEQRRRWVPTVGVGLWKDEARAEARDWRRRNPCDRFRVVKYVRAKEGER